MTDEKSTKDPKVKTSPEKPAKEEKSTSAEASADTQKPEVGSQKTEDKKKKKSTEKKPTLTQKEIDALIVENADLKANYQKNRDDLLLLAAEF